MLCVQRCQDTDMEDEAWLSIQLCFWSSPRYMHSRHQTNSCRKTSFNYLRCKFRYPLDWLVFISNDYLDGLPDTRAGSADLSSESVGQSTTISRGRVRGTLCTCSNRLGIRWAKSWRGSKSTDTSGYDRDEVGISSRLFQIDLSTFR